MAPLQIFLVCCKVYNEAAPILYRNNAFTIVLTTQYEAETRPEHILPSEEQIEEMSHVEISSNMSY